MALSGKTILGTTYSSCVLSESEDMSLACFVKDDPTIMYQIESQEELAEIKSILNKDEEEIVYLERSMNKSSLFLLLFLFVACDVKKKENIKKHNVSISQSINAEERLDSDFDGISDSEEESLGDNPYIASLPNISIWDVKELSAELSFKDIENGTVDKINSNYQKPSLGVIKRKINHLIFNNIFNGSIDSDMFPTLSDYYSSNIGCVDDHNYFKQKIKYDYYLESNEFRSFLFKSEYKLNFSDIKRVQSISRAQFKTVFAYPELNEESDPVDLRLFDEKFSFDGVDSLQSLKAFRENRIYNENKGIDSFINSPHCIYAIVEDFDYEKYGKKFKFSEVLSNQAENNTTLFIVSENETNKFSFSANKWNILEFLDEINLKVEIDSNKMILSINDKINELPYLLDYTHINETNFELRRWFYLNTENRDLFEKTLPGSVHVIAYPSLSEIIKGSSFEEILSEDVETNNHISLNGIAVGDELEVSIDVHSKILQKENIHKLISGIVKKNESRGPRGGDRVVWVDGKKACHYYEKNNDPSLSNFIDSNLNLFDSSIFKLKLGNKEILPSYISESKIYFKFIVGYQDVVNEQVHLTLPNESLRKFEYDRNISHRHVDKKSKKCSRVKNSTFTALAKRQFKYYITVKRKGVIK